MKKMSPAPPTGGEATGGIEEGDRGDGAGRLGGGGCRGRGGHVMVVEPTSYGPKRCVAFDLSRAHLSVGKAAALSLDPFFVQRRTCHTPRT